MASQYPLAKVHVTKNSLDGKATFISASQPTTQPLGPTSQLTYLYATPPFPISLTDNTDKDLDHHLNALASAAIPTFPQESGTGCVILDFAPNPEGDAGFMHKTNTLDYLVILEGELELELAGGEKKVMTKGEVVIQRACWHSWRNTSKTEGARMMAVSIGGEGAVEGGMEVGGPA